MRLSLLAFLVAALLAPAGPSDAQSLYGSVVGNVADSTKAAGARGDRDPHQQGHQPRARGHHHAATAPTASSTCSPGPTRSGSVLAGFKEYVKEDVPVSANAVSPRRRRAGGGRSSREAITVAVRAVAAADRHGLRPRRAQVQGDHEPAPRELPELPDPAQPGARDDARGLPERHHRHPRPLPHHERQRHRPQQQQHPARRRHQRLHLAPAPRGLRGAGGDGGHGQHLDQQLRRRAGHGGRRRRHRADQVRHQRVPRLRLLAARGRQPAGAQLGQLGREARQPSATSAASRWAVPSSRTSCSSSAAWEGHVRRALPARRTGTLPTAAMRAGDFSAFGTTIYDPATGNADGTRPHAVPQQRDPRQPDQPDRAAAPVAAPPAQRAGHRPATTPTRGPWTSPATTSTPRSTTTSAPPRQIWAKYSQMNATVNSDMWLGNPPDGGAGGYGFGDGSGVGDTKVKIGTLGITWTLSPKLHPRRDRRLDALRPEVHRRPTTARTSARTSSGSRARTATAAATATSGTRACPASPSRGFEPFGGVDGWTPLFRNDRTYNFSANATYIAEQARDALRRRRRQDGAEPLAAGARLRAAGVLRLQRRRDGARAHRARPTSSTPTPSSCSGSRRPTRQVAPVRDHDRPRVAVRALLPRPLAGQRRT